MQPEMSVGLIAGELRQRAETSLRHLLRQTALDRLEIIVIDLDPASPVLEGASHARVRYLRRPDLLYYCDAQAELVRQACAPLVAFVEDHCYASPGWAEAVLGTFRDPTVAAVNYAFTPAAEGYLSRSILMAEYGLWMAPHPGGPVRISSSTNLAYRREMLLPLVEGKETLYEAEFLVHRTLQKAGGRIVVAPRALIAHESWRNLGEACLANGANKRMLGSRRAAAGRFGLFRRILWAGGMGLAPPLFLVRLGWSLRRRPRLWSAFLAGVPVIAAIYCACAWNEALGYLCGPGASRQEFRQRELAVARNA